MSPVPASRGSALEKQIGETLQIFGAIEVLIDVCDRATPHVIQEVAGFIPGHL
ncbi:MAG: hypothetical protein ACM3ND_04955 [Acidobacteriota bacterium]